MDENLEKNAQRFLKQASRLRRLGSGSDSENEVQVSPSQLGLVEYVGQHAGCGVQELADALKLSAPTISVSIRQLEEKNYINRFPHPEDGRAVQLFLSETGEKLREQSQVFHRRKFEQLLAGLDEGERDTLLDLLERALDAAEK